MKLTQSLQAHQQEASGLVPCWDSMERPSERDPANELDNTASSFIDILRLSPLNRTIEFRHAVSTALNREYIKVQVHIWR
jgi:hypothetical protein